MSRAKNCIVCQKETNEMAQCQKPQKSPAEVSLDKKIDPLHIPNVSPIDEHTDNHVLYII